MPMLDDRPPRDEPPEDGARQKQEELLDMTVKLVGGAQGAVGAPRFGRGWLPTSVTA